MKRYCVYLTMYSGDKLPKWYIGSTYEEKILRGYNGSVCSKKWREIYKEEQINNKHLFKTRILSFHDTKEYTQIEELRLHRMHNVVANDSYFNESYACPSGFFGRDVSGDSNPMHGRSWLEGKSPEEILEINSRKASKGEKNGMYNKGHSEEAILKIIEGNKRFNETDEGKHKIKQAAIRLSLCMTGVPKSKEQREKMSQTSKKRWAEMPIVTCQQCGVTGKEQSMKRRHKCKFK